MPEVIIDREKEQERIGGFLEDALKGMSKALCVYGKPGIGKTIVTKHVLNQFDELENACAIYLNASSRKVYSHTRKERNVQAELVEQGLNLQRCVR